MSVVQAVSAHPMENVGAMIDQRPLVAENEADRAVGYLADVEWKMDPDLEMWVDVEASRATVRLAGVLDHRTCNNIRCVVEELLGNGCRNVRIEIDDLRVRDVDGYCTLVGIQRSVRDAGGAVTWSGWPS